MRYEGPVEVGMIFTASDDDDEPGLRRVRVLARHPDVEGLLIIEDLASRMKRWPDGPRFCPEVNLRIVFVPEARDEAPTYPAGWPGE